MYWLVLVIHVLVSLFLILVVLLQSGKSGDIAQAFGGGGTQTVFGPRGTSNVLTKATTASAVLFMLTSITLVLMGADGGKSVIDAAPQTPPAASAPAGAPTEGTENGTGAADDGTESLPENGTSEISLPDAGEAPEGTEPADGGTATGQPPRSDG